MDQIYFTIPEILSLIGVTQCVYILVYMALRAGRISRAGLPMVYFFILALAFLSDFAEGKLAYLYDRYFYFQWAAWYMGPPLSVLLIIQIAQIYKTPGLRHYRVLVLPVLAFGIAWAAMSGVPGCEKLRPCDDIQSALMLGGLVSGAFSFLSLWLERDLFSGIQDKKTGKERYWLVLAIIFINIAFLSMTLIHLSFHTDDKEFVLIRTVLGVGFAYLVGTSLFRIYPQAVLLVSSNKSGQLSTEEIKIAKKVETLLTRDKVYHEPTYSRTDLARECGASEAVISKVINIYFQKSLPQIINEYRVEDAKRLLEQTGANVKIIAEEVGFNSVASFNRVFREMTGKPPSEYRKTRSG